MLQSDGATSGPLTTKEAHWSGVFNASRNKWQEISHVSSQSAADRNSD